MDNFNNRKAEEYVERFGVELALERLGMLANSSDKAREMIKYITDKYTNRTSVSRRYNNRENEGLLGINVRRDNAKKVVLGPKEKYFNLIRKLNLNCNVETDGEYHPIIDVQWHNGHAKINGFNVNFPSDDKEFMFSNVKTRKHIALRMTILGLNKGGVIARPDIDKYYARKRKEFSSGVKKFNGDVWVNFHRNRLEITCINKDLKLSKENKRIMVPKRFLNMLFLNPGKWMFRILKETKDTVAAEPVEKINEKMQDLTRRQKEYEEKKFWQDRPIRKLADERLNELEEKGSIRL